MGKSSRESLPGNRTESQNDRVILRLWEVMTESYGHRWTSHVGEKPNATWKRRLSELTMEQIQRGIDRDFDRGDSWPPSCPEFYELALGGYNDFDMLEPDQAFKAASRRQYERPGVYDAVSAIGAYEFQRMTADRAKPAFMRAYAKALTRARSGLPLRQPVKVAPERRVTHQEPAQGSVEVGRKALAEIRAKLGMKPNHEEQQNGE